MEVSRSLVCVIVSAMLAALCQATETFADQAGRAATARAAADDCRSLYATREYERAIERCEEATRLDPRMAEAFYYLGASHDALAGPRWTVHLPAAPPLPPPPPPPPGVRAPPRTPVREGPVLPALSGRDPRSLAHLLEALSGYRRSLSLNRRDSDVLERLSQLAWRAVLEIGNLEKGKPGVPLDVGPMTLVVAQDLARAPGLDAETQVLLAMVFERQGRPDLVETMLGRVSEARPSDPAVCLAVASFYARPVWNGRSNFDRTIATLERCAALTPDDPEGYFRLEVFLWDRAYRDPTLADADRLAYVERGLSHADRALALKQKDNLEILSYKGLLLRVKAQVTSDPASRERFLEEARALARQAARLQAETGQAAAPAVSSPRPVGGEIRQPRKLKHVNAEYPSGARNAGVKGVVILNLTIDEQGRVADARVVRSIPLLDAAAVAAVKQWVYAPTLLDGVPIPVLLTVTVNFGP
jgi:TonB family protein